MRREGEKGADFAEHVIVCSHRVVVHEQLASVIGLPLAKQERVVVEVIGEMPHLLFEVIVIAKGRFFYVVNQRILVI